jgi:GxxExxY protein
LDVRVSGSVVGAAIEVHRALGPGLLESNYQRCLEHELQFRGTRFESQKAVAFSYKGLRLQNTYRVDLLVERCVVVEIKAVDQLQPIHRAQLLTYLKLMRLHVGLLINFNVHILVKGVRRVVNGF